jgi:hypothetical protein
MLLQFLTPASSYQAEIVPAAARGAVVSSIQIASSFGQIVAAGVNRAYYTASQPGG